MEIVLQWLDDLDDLVFAVAISWRSTCRFGLALGFLAAFVLTPIYGADLQIQSVIVLTAVAFSSVSAWLAAAMITIRRQQPQAA
jgi:hypothetical protein